MKTYLISLGLYVGTFLIQNIFLDFIMYRTFRNSYKEFPEIKNIRKKERWHRFVDNAYALFFNTFLIFCGLMFAELLLNYFNKTSDAEMSKYISIFIGITINTIISLTIMAILKGFDSAKMQDNLRKLLLEKKNSNPDFRIKRNGLMVQKKESPLSYIVENLYKPIIIVECLIVILVIK